MAGTKRGYALKAYSDDFGERVWAHAQLLASVSRRAYRPVFADPLSPTGARARLRLGRGGGS